MDIFKLETVTLSKLIANSVNNVTPRAEVTKMANLLTTVRSYCAYVPYLLNKLN